MEKKKNQDPTETLVLQMSSEVGGERGRGLGGMHGLSDLPAWSVFCIEIL